MKPNPETLARYEREAEEYANKKDGPILRSARAVSHLAASLARHEEFEERLNHLESEAKENARIIGISGSTELKHLTQIADLEAKLAASEARVKELMYANERLQIPALVDERKAWEIIRDQKDALSAAQARVVKLEGALSLYADGCTIGNFVKDPDGNEFDILERDDEGDWYPLGAQAHVALDRGRVEKNPAPAREEKS